MFTIIYIYWLYMEPGTYLENMTYTILILEKQIYIVLGVAMYVFQEFAQNPGDWQWLAGPSRRFCPVKWFFPLRSDRRSHELLKTCPGPTGNMWVSTNISSAARSDFCLLKLRFRQSSRQPIVVSQPRVGFADGTPMLFRKGLSVLLPEESRRSCSWVFYGWNLLIWKWPATTLKKKHGGNPKQNPKTEIMEIMEPIYDEADANWSTWWPGGLLIPGLVN